MTSRKSTFELLYSSRKSTVRWIRAALASLDESAASLCAQHWHGAQPVRVPVRVESRRR
jgi:hypothetical protein